MSLIVKDRGGNVLHEVSDINALDELDLRRADFSGQLLEGACLDGSDLREADLSGSDLYWARGFRANFDEANFRNANLAGACLTEASFRRCDLRGAYISYDNLKGSPTLEGADLTGALLDEAVLTGCKYDRNTRFSDGFDPVARGMTWVEQDRI